LIVLVWMGRLNGIVHVNVVENKDDNMTMAY